MDSWPKTIGRQVCRDSSKKHSHIYFLLIVVMVLQLWCQIVLLWHQIPMVTSEQHLYQTIVQFEKNCSITQKNCNRKYTWLHFLLLSSSGYSIWGTENFMWLMIIFPLLLTFLNSELEFDTDAIKTYRLMSSILQQPDMYTSLIS